MLACPTAKRDHVWSQGSDWRALLIGYGEFGQRSTSVAAATSVKGTGPARAGHVMRFQSRHHEEGATLHADRWGPMPCRLCSMANTLL